MSKAYYNEIDPKAAQWLRELIKENLIASGDVDERSIEQVSSTDLVGYTQCHFFAGIGGWSLALRIAGWSDSKPVWTGSCPCQPFSAAGSRKGFSDNRHLWPAFFKLISRSKPSRIYGEQVGQRRGAEWFAAVSDDLASLEYTGAVFELPACSVGAPHIRKRLYWLADSKDHRQQRERDARRRRIGFKDNGPISGMANADGGNTGTERKQRSRQQREFPQDRSTNFWSACEWLPCTDGKQRPVEPGTFPLVNGLSGRVGLLRGYGNAIVPQVAAEFIKASL